MCRRRPGAPGRCGASRAIRQGRRTRARAEQGIRRATSLGLMYAIGQGVPRDYAQAAAVPQGRRTGQGARPAQPGL